MQTNKLPGMRAALRLGEPYWRKEPPDPETVEGCDGIAIEEWTAGLDTLLAAFGELNLDVVEMVLADEDSWDRYEAAKWLNIRRANFSGGACSR